MISDVYENEINNFVSKQAIKCKTNCRVTRRKERERDSCSAELGVCLRLARILIERLRMCGIK